jgi:hypothetical protein
MDQPVFHCIATRANMLPSGQIFAIEKLLPLVGIAFAGILIFVGCERERAQKGKHKN